jgi:hypothetical protein
VAKSRRLSEQLQEDPAADRAVHARDEHPAAPPDRVRKDRDSGSGRALDRPKRGGARDRRPGFEHSDRGGIGLANTGDGLIGRLALIDAKR